MEPKLVWGAGALLILAVRSTEPFSRISNHLTFKNDILLYKITYNTVLWLPYLNYLHEKCLNDTYGT